MKQIARRYPHLLMTAILLVVSVIAMFWGERMTAHDGLGWDGRFYVDLAKSFETSVFVEKMDSYHTQRIVPSGIVHYSLRLLGMPLDNTHILWAFRIYNLLLLMLCCWFWKRIADELDLSEGGRWLGFMGLFVSFAIMKMGFYYPNMTDITALTLGLAMIHTYMRRQQWGLFAVTLIGAFTWPSIVYGGVLMLLWPRDAKVFDGDDEKASGLNILIAGGIALAQLALIGYTYFYRGNHYFGWQTSQPLEGVIYISVVLAVGSVFLGLAYLLKGISYRSIPRALRSLRVMNVVLAVAALVIARVGLGMLADMSKFTSYDMKHHVTVLTLIPISRPWISLVAHVVFYGPIILLLFLVWKRYCRTLHQYGFGLTLAVLINTPLLLGAESRVASNILPFLVVFLVAAVEDYRFRPAFYWGFAAIALIFTKVWFPINQGVHEENLLEFPAQYLFMNIGPWMNNTMYLIQGGAVVIAGLLLFAMMKKFGRETDSVTELRSNRAEQFDMNLAPAHEVNRVEV